MSFLEQVESQKFARGLDVLERLADQKGWFLERQESGEILMQCKGSWCTYNVHFNLVEEYQSMHITCEMDLRLPDDKMAEINNLLVEINSKLWIGHFAMMADKRTPAYRHTLMMMGGEAIKSLEVEEIVETALGECDRFYPAFQFVAWNDKTAEEAMAACLFECVGSA